MSGFTSKKKLPVYRHHKPSGQARVRWQGREIYLGKFVRRSLGNATPNLLIVRKFFSNS